MTMITLGLDIGSSSIKAALYDNETGKEIGHAAYPDTEMAIASPSPGFAEQDPESWWTCVGEAVGRLRVLHFNALSAVKAIGISYQMHGLVLVDRTGKVLRPSIIWCDSRAASIGKKAFDTLGHEWCLDHLLNSPGNFTASKFRWVIEHTPDIAAQVAAVMLPGDYIAYRLTDRIATTVPGLSEGMFWDFAASSVSGNLLRYYEIPPSVLPSLVPTFGNQGTVTGVAAQLLGLPAGIPVSYRAGDQPNNALSLNVLEPGEVAATAGTSGVVYAVGDKAKADPKSRINSFAHVNYSLKTPRIGILLCINGTGIANSWIRRMTGNSGVAYADLNTLAMQSPVGSRGITTLPFGNGAERLFGDRIIGSHMLGIDFPRHGSGDLIRSVQEGIAFSLVRGLKLMPSLGVTPSVIRAGHANMFLSPLFCEALATAGNVPIEIYETDGAQGAARGAAVGAGLVSSPAEAGRTLRRITTIEPNRPLGAAYADAIGAWDKALDMILTTQE
jgi:xylulokinase